MITEKNGINKGKIVYIKYYYKLFIQDDKNWNLWNSYGIHIKASTKLY